MTKMYATLVLRRKQTLWSKRHSVFFLSQRWHSYSTRFHNVFYFNLALHNYNGVVSIWHGVHQRLQTLGNEVPHIYFTFSTHKTLILVTRSVCAFHSLHTEFFYSHISSEYLLFKLSHGVRKSCATGPRYKLFSAFFLRKTRIFTYFSAFLLIFHYFHTYFTAWRP